MKIDTDSIGFVLGLQTLVGITTAYWVIGGIMALGVLVWLGDVAPRVLVAPVALAITWAIFGPMVLK